MPTRTVIDGLVERFEGLRSLLDDQHEVSLLLEADANFKKLLIMASGSFFEEQLTTMLEGFAARGGDGKLAAFVKNKALKRQYHTLFSWESRNVNTFLALFGEPFKATVTAKLAANQDLTDAMGFFLWLGSQRNQLAHGNIAAFSVSETREEIYARYAGAWTFVRFLAAEFGERCSADVEEPEEGPPEPQ